MNAKRLHQVISLSVCVYVKVEVCFLTGHLPAAVLSNYNIYHTPNSGGNCKDQSGENVCCSKGVAARGESSNGIVIMTSYLRKTIVTMAFVNDFVRGGHGQLFHLVALYRCNLFV